jgi:hypothetical protein
MREEVVALTRQLRRVQMRKLKVSHVRRCLDEKEKELLYRMGEVLFGTPGGDAFLFRASSTKRVKILRTEMGISGPICIVEYPTDGCGKIELSVSNPAELRRF